MRHDPNMTEERALVSRPIHIFYYGQSAESIRFSSASLSHRNKITNELHCIYLNVVSPNHMPLGDRGPRKYFIKINALSILFVLHAVPGANCVWEV